MKAVSLINIVIACMLALSVSAQDADPAAAAKGNKTMLSGSAVSHADIDQPAVIKAGDVLQASEVMLNGEALRAIIQQRALDAISNAIFAEPIANDVYLERMAYKAVEHDYIRFRIDSLNEVYATSNNARAILASNTAAPETKAAMSSPYPSRSSIAGLGLPHKEEDGEAAVSSSEAVTAAVRGTSKVIGSAFTGYAVVLGSFAVEDNAVKYNSRLRKRGYKTQIVYSEEIEKHRVLIAADSKNAARGIHKGIRSSAKIKDAWILQGK